MQLQSFDVLVTDLEMPDVDGRILIANARSTVPPTSCIVVSGATIDPSTLPDCIFLAKPASADEIRNAIARKIEER